MKQNIKVYKSRDVFATEMMQKYIDNISTKVVSDIGAGFGLMRLNVENLGLIWQPFDYIKKLPETVIWDLDNPAPKSVNKASSVLLLEVIEHFSNPFKAIENIASHLEKNGVLILTTPNPQSSKNIINLFLKGTLYSFQPKHLEEHHVFTPWEHIVSYFLKENGFEIKEYGIIDIHYKNRKPENIKDFFKKRVEAYLEKRNPKALGMSYGLVAIKK